MREKLFCLILATILVGLAISGCGPYSEDNYLPPNVSLSSPTSLPATQQPVILPTSVATDDPIVSITPSNGQSGTLVQVTASGFPPNMPISIGMGPANSGFGEVAQGLTDENGIFVAYVTAQGSLGMNLVFAASVGGQPGVLSQTQFQITGAVPNPQPVSPTATLHLDMWQEYSNQVFAIALQYPADWLPVEGYYAPETGDVRYGGINGFFQIGAMDADSIDQATASEAEHVLQPYGSQPTIEVLQVHGQEARLIMPSTDQPSGMQYQAAIIIQYPKPVNILGTPCRYFVLWSDWPHIRTIAHTIRFTD